MNEKRRKGFAQDILIISVAIPISLAYLALIGQFGKQIPPVRTVLRIIAEALSVLFCWRVFNKAGVPGWKALIPYYRDYVLWKTFYGHGVLILIAYGLNLLFQILDSRLISDQLAKLNTIPGVIIEIAIAMALLSFVVWFLIHFYRCNKAIAASFVKSKRFAFWGLCVFNIVGMGILAYDSSEPIHLQEK